MNNCQMPARLLFLSCLYLVLSACTAGTRQVQPTGSEPSLSESALPRAKNVILFIGDGMGVSTVTAIRILDGQQKGMKGEENVLPFERFGHVALSKTYVVDQQVGESAGTATAIMTGRKTNAGMIGVNHLTMRGNCASSKGNHNRSVLEYAEIAGLSTGIVTTTRLTHATPASGYAHAASRNWESDYGLTGEARENGCADIASQLIDFPFGNGIEVAMGGGRTNFLPATTTDPEGSGTVNSRQDGRNLALEWTRKFPNSAYIWNQSQFDAIDPSATEHLLGLFSSGHMNYEADRAGDAGGEPSLAEMTTTAIEILKRNPEGYFLLVEGGRIDHAHHANNAYRALTDGIAFADAVQAADEMTNADDTLIIVTADHSHVLTIAGYPVRGNPILGKVFSNGPTGMPNDSFDLLSDNKPYTTLGYQNGPGSAWVGGPRPDLSDVDTIHDKEFLQQAGIPRSSESHGGEDVAIYAQGPGAENVRGVMEQNLIFDVMNAALNLTERAQTR